MELEFDKEIDAMLRKARSGIGTGVGTAGSAHLDADIIAAFAENALPQHSKLLYMEHFADCGRCRKQLSQAITMNSEADAAAASSISAVSMPEAEAMVPWYEKLLKTQDLALAMGALLLAFTGSIGYLLMQGGMGESATSVSQVTEQDPARGGPFFGSDDDASNTNANVSPMSNSAGVALQAANSNAVVDLKDREADKASNRSEPAAVLSTTGTEKSASGADTTAPAMKETLPSDAKPAAPPPPPFQIDGSSGSENDFIIDGQEAKETELSKKRSESDDRARYRRDAPPAAAKSGPARAGPLQNQSNQSNTFDMTVTRNAGGKKFNNRDGAWYDTEYRGQSTINIRRGTDEYNKLDSGLRDIANTIGGTVVVVWKGKAYRIR